VRGGVVVLGGLETGQTGPEVTVRWRSWGVIVTRQRLTEADEDSFKILLTLSCGAICDPAAVVIDESEGDQGQVLLIGV
jgi:hypothetical protein